MTDVTLEDEIQYYEDFLKDVTPSGLIHMLQEIIIVSHADTFTHLHRTAHFVYKISRELGFSEHCAKVLACTSSLHDIAKVSLPKCILDKDGSLTVKEYERVQTHTTLGHQILSHGGNRGCTVASEVALQHHEWFGGGGYPTGLKGNLISLAARITSVADVFEALIGERKYKEKWTEEDAFAYIKANKNLQFDPIVVDAFVSLEEDIMTTKIPDHNR